MDLNAFLMDECTPQCRRSKKVQDGADSVALPVLQPLEEDPGLMRWTCFLPVVRTRPYPPPRPQLTRDFGVGGILCAADAQEKIDAGASLVQLYTGLIYRGPALVSECAAALRKSALRGNI